MIITWFLRRFVALAAARRRFLIAAPIVLAAAAPSTALANSGVQCASSSTYGGQCISVYGSGLKVTDVQSWFTPPSTSYLSGRKWRTALEDYNCDPIHNTKSECPVYQEWYTAAHSGNPPHNSTACAGISGEGLSYQYCQDYGVAFAQASFGDWSGFSVPHTFGSEKWMCTELQVYNSTTGKWVYNAAGLQYGLRACVDVHS
jgi:hypothetical protein